MKIERDAVVSGKLLREAAVDWFVGKGARAARDNLVLFPPGVFGDRAVRAYNPNFDSESVQRAPLG